MKLLPLICLLAAPCLAEYRPDRDGASTTVGLEVVDVQEKPIEGAKVMFRVFKTFDDCYRLMRDTDAKGYCEISGKTRGEITVVITKDGFYPTYGNLEYCDLTWDESVAEHRWTRGVVRNQLRMKPIVRPEKHISDGMTLKAPPVKNQFVPFDVFATDWCAPFGRGTVKDFEIACYDITNSVKGWVRGVAIKADNCVDGFAFKKIDSWSKFKYALTAEEQDVYQKEVRFGWVPNEAGEVARGRDFRGDSYMVFRVRTETNSVGKVIAANYGIIDENLDFQDGLTLNVRVNPRQNDTSLEHNWAFKHMKNEQ